ncbi:uncharacterized protein LOC135610632 isoform X1 [Musa acuminata AAA Group]|uniref:uncharacterized protein LOC135610632 isoform X1 n=1 Tax=Musa acuminata AAA Group TaxID=214697 RepID=UPI0031DC315F
MHLICVDRRILHRSASLVSPSLSIADFTFCPWNFSAFRIRGADRRSDPWRKRRRPSRNPPAATSATVASPPSAAGSQKDDTQALANSSDVGADSISRLTLHENTDLVAKATSGESIVGVPECKCGMPLCICVTPTPEPAPMQMQGTTMLNIQSNPKPRKTSSSQQPAESISRKHAATSSSKPSSFFNLGQASNNAVDEACANYDVSGEGLREAIKNSDSTAVRELLSKGVDPNYCDKQGLTLLHLAAVFNQTDIAFILMDHGASTESKNAQGETPLDCAPTMLQYKMRNKAEELAGTAQAI